MLVHFATAYPTRWSYVPRFSALAEIDRIGEHRVTSDPVQADLILFVDARHEHGDWRFKAIRNHPLTKNYPQKCFVYNETDQPWCFMPGIYVSMPKRWFNSRRMVAWSYIGLMNPHIENNEEEKPDLLFSFIGRRCVTVREKVLDLRHRNAVIEDSSEYNFFGSAKHSAEQMERRRIEYSTLLRRSKFVICPRGSGPASFRLFETLAAGRVPVIVSDEWVEPKGPDWETCSVRVPEADVAKIPQLLEQRNSEWAQLAKAATGVWENWFAPSVQFHRIAEACKGLMEFKGSFSNKIAYSLNLRRIWLEARILKGSYRSRLHSLVKTRSMPMEGQ